MAPKGGGTPVFLQNVVNTGLTQRRLATRAQIADTNEVKKPPGPRESRKSVEEFGKEGWSALFMGDYSTFLVI